MSKFEVVNYDQLNPRQKESYNFQKASAILADYGFKTILLSDDWNGADFLAVHVNGETFLKVQLKSRLTFMKKYLKKELYICFRHETDWFLYPHDELFRKFESESRITNTKSWTKDGKYSFSTLSSGDRNILIEWKMG